MKKRVAERGIMKKRVAEIEDVVKGAQCVQPPSLYVSVTTPLEVWPVPDPSSTTPQTIFYKVLQVQECDSIIELSDPNHDVEEVLMIMKAEPWMACLLEKSGITLRRNNRMPPPPPVCEEWWRQAENFVRRRRKVQPMFGLGYRNMDASDDEDEHFNVNQVHCLTITASSKDYAGCSHYAKRQQQSMKAGAVKMDEELDALSAPQQLEDGSQPTIDELMEINLGTEDDRRTIFVSAMLSEGEREDYWNFLMEYRDCFAWNYKEMPGLDPRVAMHKLAIDPQFCPVKQPARRLRPEFEDQVIAEVHKLIKVGFIKEIQYPRWLANIVPVEKKNGQVRVCVDFRNLNRACPKDDFPLPITEMVVDATTGFGALSFMDGSSGYNQIKMDPVDALDTAFRTPRGNFYYTVMPFGLKNTGTTYQRAMTYILDNLIHQSVECYVDDMVVKTKDRKDHQDDLWVVFERLRRHQLKMNPLKYAFAV